MIRRAGPQDLNSIMTIEQQCFPKEAWPRSSFALGLSSSDSLYLIAQEKGEAQGYVMAFVRPGGQKAHIGSLAVRPVWQGHGLGQALVAALLEECRKQGFHAFRAETRQSSLHVRRLFSRFGFYEAGILKDYYRHPREDGVLLCLDPQALDAEAP